jgi:hypothetical protein
MNRVAGHNTFDYRVAEIWPDHLGDGLRDLTWRLDKAGFDVVTGTKQDPFHSAADRPSPAWFGSGSHLDLTIQRKVGFKSLCDGVVDTTTASGELIFPSTSSPPWPSSSAG